MMNKNKGLGSMPKGVEWLNKRVNANMGPKAPVEPKVIPDSTPEVITLEAQETPKEIIMQTAVVAQNTKPANAKKEATKTAKVVKSAQAGLPSGWTRSTFIVKEEYVNKLKLLSLAKDGSLKDVLDDALNRYFANEDIKSAYRSHLKKMHY